MGICTTLTVINLFREYKIFLNANPYSRLTDGYLSNSVYRVRIGLSFLMTLVTEYLSLMTLVTESLTSGGSSASLYIPILVTNMT